MIKMIRFGEIFAGGFVKKIPPPEVEFKTRATPEAIAYGIGLKLVRDYGSDASRLADVVVKAVQDEMRRKANDK